MGGRSSELVLLVSWAGVVTFVASHDWESTGHTLNWKSRPCRCSEPQCFVGVCTGIFMGLSEALGISCYLPKASWGPHHRHPPCKIVLGGLWGLWSALVHSSKFENGCRGNNSFTIAVRNNARRGLGPSSKCPRGPVGAWGLWRRLDQSWLGIGRLKHKISKGY